MANPFRVAESGPVFESEDAACAAGDFFIEALGVLMHDFSTKAAMRHPRAVLLDRKGN